jgi:hypothetical protein
MKSTRKTRNLSNKNKHCTASDTHQMSNDVFNNFYSSPSNGKLLFPLSFFALTFTRIKQIDTSRTTFSLIVEPKKAQKGFFLLILDTRKDKGERRLEENFYCVLENPSNFT